MTAALSGGEEESTMARRDATLFHVCFGLKEIYMCSNFFSCSTVPKWKSYRSCLATFLCPANQPIQKESRPSTSSLVGCSTWCSTQCSTCSLSPQGRRYMAHLVWSRNPQFLPRLLSGLTCSASVSLGMMMTFARLTLE